MHMDSTLLQQTLLIDQLSDDRSLLVKKIRLWGDLNTDALLESSCRIFQTSEIEGFIGYQLHYNCAVVLGEPVTDAADKKRLADAFQAYCKKNKFNIVYAIVSKEFANLVSFCPIHIQFGNKLILNPSIDPLTRKGSKAVLVRKKVKHATNDGVIIQEYFQDDPLIETEMQAIAQHWLNSRNGPQVYIANLNLFSDSEGKRWFIATQGERVVGLLLLHKIQASQGWLLNHLMLAPHAPHGTSEMLIVSTFQALEKENCKCVVVGPVTSDELQELKGLGSFTSWSLRMLFKTAKKIFRLDGQTKFWEKFQAEQEPSFLLFDKINLRTIKALLRAVNTRT